jgi:hypothetical protein
MATRKQLDAIEHFTLEIMHGLRTRGPFSEAKRRQRFRPGAIDGAKWLRIKLRMDCVALRLLREQL